MTDDLIKKLREATGPSRELDCDIERAIHPNSLATALIGVCQIGSVPRYTSSIDAAMSLVPAGWYGRVEPRFYEGEVVRWRAYAIKPDWSKVGTPLERDDFPHTAAEAATPTGALCIAALEARKGIRG